MNFSTTALPDNRVELRFWTTGRNGFNSRKRFDNNTLLNVFKREATKLAAFGDAYVKRYAKGESFEDLLLEIKNPRVKNGDHDPFFGDELEFWKLHKSSKFAPGWKSNVEAYEAEFEELKLFKVSQIDKTLMYSIEAQLRAKENSQNTINLKIGWIKGVLNFSVDNDRIKHNPIARFKKTKAPEVDIEFWELEEAQAFLNFADAKYPREAVERWIYVAYLAALNTAARAGELWALKPKCKMQQSDLLRITEQFNLRSQTFSTTKGKRNRNVPCTGNLRVELELLEKQFGLKRDQVYFSWRGQPMSHDHFLNIFEKDIAQWGGKRIVFHGLRHTGATLMLKAGVKVEDLQKVLGHRDIKTTMRYVHLLAQSVEDVGKTYSLAGKAHLRVVS